MPNIDPAEDILVSKFESEADQHQLDEVQLLEEIAMAIAQVEAGQGIPQEEAYRKAIERVLST